MIYCIENLCRVYLFSLQMLSLLHHTADTLLFDLFPVSDGLKLILIFIAQNVLFNSPYFALVAFGFAKEHLLVFLPIQARLALLKKAVLLFYGGIGSLFLKKNYYCIYSPPFSLNL